ncbi:Replication-relaxation [Alteribacillus persepolensis]|uniref:Replication-relaxation n=1 Tax=Alteribacillus persepolensis TaxID=568899 RepID=A0A1G8ICL0_9BACI|nr:replication-relaxation family protein [Alteribacillus persepolensis]SDI16592.1 Replication-relaxation [Alteribacillus persepolensis]
MSLKKLDYLTREQIQIIHDLKSARNANRILNNMDEYLCSFRHGLEKVYYLNKLGRERVGCKVVRKRTTNVQHFLLRNQLYIMVGCPSSWKNEMRLKTKEAQLVCDAKFDYKNVPRFVEVDCSQSMQKNERKIEKYRTFAKYTNFSLIWVTELESRKPRLERLCNGLSFDIYTAKQIK